MEPPKAAMTKKPERKAPPGKKASRGRNTTRKTALENIGNKSVQDESEQEQLSDSEGEQVEEDNSGKTQRGIKIAMLLTYLHTFTFYRWVMHTGFVLQYNHSKTK